MAKKVKLDKYAHQGINNDKQKPDEDSKSLSETKSDHSVHIESKNVQSGRWELTLDEIVTIVTQAQSGALNELTPFQILLSQRHAMSSIQSQSEMSQKTDHRQDTTVQATEKRHLSDDITLQQPILQTQKQSQVYDNACVNIQMQQQQQQLPVSSDINPQNIIHMQPQGQSGVFTQMVCNQNVDMPHGQPLSVQQQGSIVTQMNPPNIDQIQCQSQVSYCHNWHLNKFYNYGLKSRDSLLDN